MKSRVRLAALILALAWAGGVGCSPASEKKGEAAGRGVEGGSFRVSRVVPQRLERTILATGTLLPMDETPVSVKVPGRLVEIAVDLGSQVKEGDVLARVEDVDYALRVRQSEAALGQARARVGLSPEGDDDRVAEADSSAVKQAKAVLEEARANRERILALSQQGILSTSELETATATFTVASSRYEEALEEARIRVAQLKQRRAEYEIARQQLADTAIRAPFTGAVQERRANLGEYLAVGATVVVLVREDPLRLRVEVAERDAPRVGVDQAVHVSVEGDGLVSTGRVKRLSPAIVQGSRTLVVEADVPARGRLRPGSFARARIVTVPEATALTVPPEALLVFAGVEKVFLVEDGLAVEKRVTTGERGADWVEIAEGLQGGETVVLAPGNLQTGQRVAVVSELAPTAAHPPGATGRGS